MGNFPDYECIVTNKLGFPSQEMINFDETRNDLYVTLESAEIKDGKNIEVIVEVKLDNGERLKVDLII
jgi:hypothetical protein